MQYYNTEDFPKATSLQNILDQSFLQPWLLQNVVVPAESGGHHQLADYAILLGDRLTLIIEKSVTFAAFSGVESLAYSKQKRIAQDTNKIFNRDKVALLKKSMSIRASSHPNKTITLPEALRIKVIMVSKINIARDGKLSSIKHGYGNEFYASPTETQSKIVENTPTIITQYFSLGNFKKLIHGLQTIVDVMDFIDFHKRVVSESTVVFTDTNDLLKSYIASSAIFNRAKNIDCGFVDSGLRSEPAPILKKQTAVQHIKNYKLITKNAQFWSKVLNSILPTYNDDTTENLQMMHALSEESLYSRHVLTSCMLDFIQSSTALQQSGYMMHMRSYSDPNKHYAFLFYSQDEDHQYHRSIASSNLTMIAEQINQHQQPDHLADIIIIGLQKSDTGFDIDLKYLNGYQL